jgi:hypothetical protein
MRCNDCRISVSRLVVNFLQTRWWFSTLDFGDLFCILRIIKQLVHAFDKPFVTQEDLSVQSIPNTLSTDAALYKTLVGLPGSPLVTSERARSGVRSSTVGARSVVRSSTVALPDTNIIATILYC